MADRQVLPLPFGQGIDRASGGMVVDPTAFNDMRNVHLNRGRAEYRVGLLRTVLFPAPYTDLLGVYLVRAQGLAGAVLYDSVSRLVSLYAVDSTGVASTKVADLWTLPAGATSPPRISATDSYDQLIIAHDEPVYPARAVTMVYSAVAATVDPLLLDLGRTGSTEAVKFRGVRKHLAYIVGWGYGTNQPDQGDRGEVLRISMPGEPTNFISEHYFLVGTQGDPIIGCGPCGNGLAVQKIASSHFLKGSDRQTFGVLPLDPAYGMAGSRLGVAVNDNWFFWSLTGPRVTNGGPSSDLGVPLALDGPVPDALAAAGALEDGFAYYDANQREIVFCFAQWAYVLHQKDGDRRWSYRQFAVPLVNAGLLFVGGNLALAVIVAHPEPVGMSWIAPTYGVGDGTPKLTIPWSIVGGAVTTEQTEVWVKPQMTGGTWKRKAIVAATALTATFTVDEFFTTYDVALRFVSGGFAGAGYASSDPANWPAVSRGTVATVGSIVNFVVGKWQRYTSISQGFDILTLTGPGLNVVKVPANLRYRFERDAGAGFVALTTADTYAAALVALRFLNSESLTSQIIRVRAEAISGPASSTAWFAIGSRVIAPEPPTTLAIAATTRVPNNVDDAHDTTWAAPTAVNGQAPADGPFEVRGRHISPPSAPGAWGTVAALSAGVHAKLGLVFPLVDPSTGGTRSAELNARVALVSGDVSPWVNVFLFEP